MQAIAHLGIPSDVLEPLASNDLELHIGVPQRSEKHAQAGHGASVWVGACLDQRRHHFGGARAFFFRLTED